MRKNAELVFDVARSVGMDLPEVRYSRDHSSLQYGYSYLHFLDSKVLARQEGEGQIGKYSIEISYKNENWIDECLSVLSFGRTIECGKGVRFNRDHVHFQTGDFSLVSLSNEVRGQDPWIVDPDYQRGHVWTTRQGERFVGHLLEYGRAPLIFVQDNGFGRPREVVDGKQRITACLRFLDGEIAAELLDGRRIWWKDFNEIDRRTPMAIRVGFLRLPDRAAVLRFYLLLNRGGTRHTDEEIEHVQGLLQEEEGKAP